LALGSNITDVQTVVGEQDLALEEITAQGEKF